MIKFILKYLFVFISGSILGWCLEVVYRRYFGLAKKWINPGFLSGPYLPLYGSALCVLYIISDMHILFYIKVMLFAIVTTSLEYLTGLFFLRVYHTRLWDYRKLKFNIQGLISPLYSLFWLILSLVFYYLLYPYFYEKIQFLYENLEFSLFVGFVLGIIFFDFIQAFNVLKKLHYLADQVDEFKVIIEYEKLKLEIRERFKHRGSFLFPFSGEFNLKQSVKEHAEKIRIRVNNFHK